MQGGGSWWNQSFTDQTGMFHVEFTATPSAGNVDAVFGLSAGAATKWTSLAAIARFNPQGFIDARNGSTYSAAQSLSYEANHTYYFRLDVDVKAHTYSAWVEYWPNGGYSLIGRNYAFRTEQASVTHLNNIASFVNPETGAPTGSVQLCGVVATADTTTADNCIVNVAGGTFVNKPINASTNVLMVSFSAVPSLANMDGVIGVTSGDADAYNDYAASLRFYTNGVIEARDGDTYRADVSVPYAANQQFRFRMFIDIASHTYSLYVEQDDDSRGAYWTRLASGYKFRPTQASVTSLDRVATVIASSSGRLDTCGVTGGPHQDLIAVRDGTYDVLPLSDGSALMSDGSKTLHLDAHNAIAGSVGFGGQVAIDAAGSYYVANLTNGVLAVRSYTPAFVQRWSVSYPVNGSDTVLDDMVVASTGQVVLAIGSAVNPYSPDRTVQYLLRLGSDGSYVANDPLPAGTTAVGLQKSQYVAARAVDSGVELGSHTYASPGSATRLTTVPGDYVVQKIAVAPDGSFAIAGRLNSAVTFGPDTVEPYSNPDFGTWDAFAAGFSPEFAPMFGQLVYSQVWGLATTGSQILVASEEWTQLQYIAFWVFDPTGAVLRFSDEDEYVGNFGRPGTAALASSGRIFMNVYVSFGSLYDAGGSFLITLAP